MARGFAKHKKTSPHQVRHLSQVNSIPLLPRRNQQIGIESHGHTSNNQGPPQVPRIPAGPSSQRRAVDLNNIQLPRKHPISSTKNASLPSVFCPTTPDRPFRRKTTFNQKDIKPSLEQPRRSTLPASAAAVLRAPTGPSSYASLADKNAIQLTQEASDTSQDAAPTTPALNVNGNASKTQTPLKLEQSAKRNSLFKSQQYSEPLAPPAIQSLQSMVYAIDSVRVNEERERKCLKLRQFAREHEFFSRVAIGQTFSKSERLQFQRTVQDLARGLGLSNSEAKKEQRRLREFCSLSVVDDTVSAWEGEVDDDKTRAENLLRTARWPPLVRKRRLSETDFDGESSNNSSENSSDSSSDVSSDTSSDSSENDIGPGEQSIECRSDVQEMKSTKRCVLEPGSDIETSSSSTQSVYDPPSMYESSPERQQPTERQRYFIELEAIAAQLAGKIRTRPVFSQDRLPMSIRATSDLEASSLHRKKEKESSKKAERKNKRHKTVESELTAGELISPDDALGRASSNFVIDVPRANTSKGSIVQATDPVEKIASTNEDKRRMPSADELTAGRSIPSNSRTLRVLSSPIVDAVECNKVGTSGCRSDHSTPSPRTPTRCKRKEMKKKSEEGDDFEVREKTPELGPSAEPQRDSDAGSGRTCNKQYADKKRDAMGSLLSSRDDCNEGDAADRVSKASLTKSGSASKRRKEENIETVDSVEANTSSKSQHMSSTETATTPSPLDHQVLETSSGVSEMQKEIQLQHRTRSVVQQKRINDAMILADEFQRARSTPRSSRYFDAEKRIKQSCISFPRLDAPEYGLIQERLAGRPFHLLSATIFLNRTKGEAAIPFILSFCTVYDAPEKLANSSPVVLEPFVEPLGLQYRRSRQLVALAEAWVKNPPARGRRWRRLHYPKEGSGFDIRKFMQPLEDDDPRLAFEVAHYPSVGPYALDSWRIFCRDALREVSCGSRMTPAKTQKDFDRELQQEWTRVLPGDKELRRYLQWRWIRLGYLWDPLNGRKEKVEMSVIKDMEDEKLLSYNGWPNPWLYQLGMSPGKEHEDPVRGNDEDVEMPDDDVMTILNRRKLPVSQRTYTFEPPKHTGIQPIMMEPRGEASRTAFEKGTQAAAPPRTVPLTTSSSSDSDESSSADDSSSDESDGWDDSDFIFAQDMEKPTAGKDRTTSKMRVSRREADSVINESSKLLAKDGAKSDHRINSQAPDSWQSRRGRLTGSKRTF